MIDPYSLRPLGNRVVVKRDPMIGEIGGLELPTTAAGKKRCKWCHTGIIILDPVTRKPNGWRGADGCFIRPVYEEDGLKIARHEEIPCEKCGGRSYKSLGYDPRTKLQETKATVIAVGPGAQKCVLRQADFTVLKWKDGRERIDLKPGDRVLLAKWATERENAMYLDDLHMIVRDFEVLALLDEADSSSGDHPEH